MRLTNKRSLPFAMVLGCVVLLGACSREHNTELMNAAKAGNLQVVLAILERGTEINQSTSKGKQALMFAASEGHVEVAQALLERGALVNAADNYGTTALIVAATAGHHQVVKLLLDHDANPAVRDENGGAPLVNAVYFGHAETAKLLLVKLPNLEMQDSEELLLLASGLGHADIVGVMIDHGVSVNGRGLKQRTALMAAAAFNRLELVKLLLARGADPAARDEDGSTALAVARDKGNDEVAALLSTAAR